MKDSHTRRAIRQDRATLSAAERERERQKRGAERRRSLNLSHHLVDERTSGGEAASQTTACHTPRACYVARSYAVWDAARVHKKGLRFSLKQDIKLSICKPSVKTWQCRFRNVQYD
ncbi:hypothetical protein AOLI_G00265140 [Acnodon oligacanthus]